MSIIFRYQPRQQQQLQRQRLPRLLFAVLDVAVAVVEVVAAAVDVDVVVVAAAVVELELEHEPEPGRGPAACVRESHDRDDSASWHLASGCCEDLVGWDSRPDLRGRFVATVALLSILASIVEAFHFGELHCTFAVWDAAGQTQQLTYRPCWVLATVGQQPTVDRAGLATRVPPYLETDGDKPDRILGSPRPKALAVFWQIDDTVPRRLPTDGRCCCLRR